MNIVFDLCGTLFKSNTTFDYVRYLHPIYSKIIFSLPSRLISKLFNHFLGWDLVRKWAIYSLKGMSEVQLRSAAKQFYDEKLYWKKNDKIIALLKKNIRENLYIASASIEPVVSVVADRLGVGNFVSTKLEMRNGYCTGKISLDALKNKDFLLNFSEIELVVTDNKSDANLIGLSRKAIFISKRKYIEFWLMRKRAQDEIIEVD